MTRPSEQTVRTHRLSNGLTVYAMENHTQPLVTLDMWVKVGSKDEPEDIAGISHFLEHMLFKGTERLAVGQYDRRIEELGGYLNAGTSTDYTHYYVTLPSAKMADALVDMADVLQNSSIHPEEVEKERLVILEEIRQKQDNAIGFLYDEITRSTFESGPYAGTVIGSAATVSAMSRQQLADHYHRFYAPENMVFIAVGDFDTEALLGQLEDLFGRLDRPRRPWREADPPTAYSTPTQKAWERDWQQTYYFLAFPAEPLRTLEQAAILDVAESALVGGRSARLVNRLREKRRLAEHFSGFLNGQRHPSFSAFYAICDEAKIDELREAFFEEMDLLRREGLKPGELARAKRQTINGHLYATETNTGKATMLGYSFAVLDSPDLLTHLPVAADAVTEEQILAVLERFTPDRASSYLAKPAKREAAV
ncbi:MAG: pitrilysin family protein [Sumerlaeia bacterium]